MLKISAIPAFQDNYIWLLERDGAACVVDPGDAAPVQRRLQEQGLRLTSILITHHHPDHIGGVGTLLRDWSVPVYGPRAESRTIPQLTRQLAEGDRVELPDLHLALEVLEVPGHTLGHIAYYAAPEGAEPGRLFCGDTLFSAGCGRLFEGTAEQLYGSLRKLDALPGDTAVYCTHEYTLSNLRFALTVEPDNADALSYREEVQRLRESQRPSLPSSIARERRVNPFLRVTEPAIMQSVQRHMGENPTSPAATFAALRRWKDRF